MPKWQKIYADDIERIGTYSVWNILLFAKYLKLS